MRKGGDDGGGGGGGGGGWERIIFNFPHVGGLTKDVNRQVRYNQGKVVTRFFTIISIAIR